MNVGIVIWLFSLALLVNLVSALNIRKEDKARYEAVMRNEYDAYGRMLKNKLFKFFIKFDKKSDYVFLRTFISNILLLVSILLEIGFFVLALVYSDDGLKIIMSYGQVISSLIIGSVVTFVCKYKRF